ncbi:MAG TPA: biotin transporter BioY [Firmicutes bacterium]|jgi:biotin transport system substrate-specific component|nr:biotin transporter BioY [Bacillota bacterium]
MPLAPRELVLAACFAALACLGSLLLRFGSAALVPFSLLPFVAVLAGGLLGPRIGAISMGLYTLIGLFGVPVFHRPPFGGPAYLLQPTFGFIPGFILAAWLTGWLLAHRHGELRYQVATVLGVVAPYIVGLPYFYFIMNFYLGQAVTPWRVMELCFFPFILFDLIKALLAGRVIALTVRRVKWLPGVVKPARKG